MQIRVAFSICAAMCLPEAPPVVGSAAALKRRTARQEADRHDGGDRGVRRHDDLGLFVEGGSAHKELDTLAAAGVNFLDTAEIYP